MMLNNKGKSIRNQNFSSYKQENYNFIATKKENIKTVLITITKDKLENILLKEFENIKKRADWKTPFSTFITSSGTLLTADFKDFLVCKEVWKNLFLIIMIISAICFLLNFIRAKKISERDLIDDLINKIEG